MSLSPSEQLPLHLPARRNISKAQTRAVRVFFDSSLASEHRPEDSSDYHSENDDGEETARLHGKCNRCAADVCVVK